MEYLIAGQALKYGVFKKIKKMYIEQSSRQLKMEASEFIPMGWRLGLSVKMGDN